MTARILTGLATGAAYSLVAVGVVLIFKCTRTLSLAQGEIGAFGFFIGLRWADRGVPGTGWALPRFGTLVVAVVAAVLLSAAVERFVMRRLVTRPPLDAVVATLGIALFLALTERELFGTATQFAPSPIGEGRIVVAGATLSAVRLTAFGAAGVVAAAAALFFTRTRFGLAVRATTGDPTVARLMGVPVHRVYAFAWMTAGALAGLAAALLAPAFGGLTPFAMTRFALRALAGAVIGGLDSIGGAIVGSLLVGLTESLVAGTTGVSGSAELAVLVLVVGMLLLRPQGLFGSVGAR
jgi:branched-chain amino acid transport system permease protein